MANLFGLVQSSLQSTRRKWKEITTTTTNEGEATERRAVDTFVQGIVPGENHIGEVGGSSIQVSATVHNTAEAYNGTTASGPVCVGTKFTLNNAMRKSGGTGILQSLVVIDTDNIKAPLTLLIFNQDPTNGVYTNKSAPVFNNDIANLIRAIPINISDYQVIGGVAIADLSPGSRMLTGVGSANLYGLLVLNGNVTYLHDNVLTVKAGIMRD